VSQLNRVIKTTLLATLTVTRVFSIHRLWRSVATLHDGLRFRGALQAAGLRINGTKHPRPERLERSQLKTRWPRPSVTALNATAT
jgi:hypothetical protein